MISLKRIFLVLFLIGISVNADLQAMEEQQVEQPDNSEYANLFFDSVFQLLFKGNGGLEEHPDNSVDYICPDGSRIAGVKLSDGRYGFRRGNFLVICVLTPFLLRWFYGLFWSLTIKFNNQGVFIYNGSRDS